MIDLSSLPREISNLKEIINSDNNFDYQSKENTKNIIDKIVHKLNDIPNLNNLYYDDYTIYEFDVIELMDQCKVIRSIDRYIEDFKQSVINYIRHFREINAK